MTSRSFLSDNAAGVHPEVIEALIEANRGHAPAYSLDPWTEHAKRLFARHFGENAETLFVLTGTAANVIALNSVTTSYEAVICADYAHLHREECGAPEKFLGSKLLLAQSDRGKLSPESVEPLLSDTGMVHRVQPKVLSIAECTEWGTVYTADEIRALADFCHECGLFLHMDGARLCNAAAALGVKIFSSGMLFRNSIHFLTGFLVLGIWIWHKSGLRFKTTLYLVLALSVAYDIFEYLHNITRYIRLEMILHDLYVLLWGGSTGYLCLKASKRQGIV